MVGRNLGISVSHPFRALSWIFRGFRGVHEGLHGSRQGQVTVCVHDRELVTDSMVMMLILLYTHVPSVCFAIYLPIYLFIYASIYRSIYHSVYLSICLSACLRYLSMNQNAF